MVNSPIAAPEERPMRSRLSLVTLCGFLSLACAVSLHWGLAGADGQPLRAEPSVTGVPPSRQLAPVEVRGEWGFADRAGKLRIAPRFDYARPFSEGPRPSAKAPSGASWIGLAG